MRYAKAVQHLKGLGLQVVVPERKPLRKMHAVAYKKASSGGTPRRAGGTKAQIRAIVPVRVVKHGALPNKLLRMIRQSRAEARNASSPRKS